MAFGPEPTAEHRLEKGILRELLGRRVMHHAATSQDGDVRTVVQNLFEAVGDEENRETGVAQCAEKLKEAARLAQAQSGRGFIKHENVASVQDGARDRDQLTLGDRQRVDSRVDVDLCIDATERFARNRSRRAPIQTSQGDPGARDRARCCRQRSCCRTSRGADARSRCRSLRPPAECAARFGGRGARRSQRQRGGRRRESSPRSTCLLRCGQRARAAPPGRPTGSPPRERPWARSACSTRRFGG